MGYTLHGRRTPPWRRFYTQSDGTITRFCTRCREYKQTEEFALKSNSKDGYQFYCKKCQKTYYQLWSSAARERRQ